MADSPETQPADDIQLEYWIRRWDLMQKRYVAYQPERFDVVVGLIRDTQSPAARVLDLGCGSGTLLAAILAVLPNVHVIGIDFEPGMLRLASARLRGYEPRAQTVLANLLDPSWSGVIESPADAVVTTMTFHCFNVERLSLLYRQIANVLRPGGIFLNADHVSSDYPPIQQAWRCHRDGTLVRQAHPDSDDWEGFWQKYSAAAGLNLGEIRRREADARSGHVKGGLPLIWHLDRLRQSGFVSVDCFWRNDTDAVYGGIRGGGNAG